MKPDSITIPVTLTFDPAGQELAELARHIVTRLTDEGALDEAAEHGHGIMATSAAIEWARERLGNHNPPHPIVLSSVIGEGTLRKLKVVEADADGHGAVVEMRPDGSLWFWPEGAFGEDAATDISSALPFLPGLKPGDTVYLLDGFTQSVECDGGRCGLSHRGCYPGDTSWCSSCDQMIPTERNGRFVTHWHRPMRRPCPFPVDDAPDRPCVLEAA